MSNSLTEYVDALERLKSNKPVRVAKNIRITNDSVALEAGRGKGSIKKSRAIFADLIQAIDDAAAAQSNSASTERVKLEKAKVTTGQYRDELDAALAREVSLLHELYHLKKQLAQLTGSSVIPIRKSSPPVAKNGQRT